MTPNRLVALLTPLVFAPLAGSISALAAKYFPFVEVPTGALQEIFIAGALIAFAKAAQWTQGWQKYEEREALRADAAEQLDAREAAISAREAELEHLELHHAGAHAEAHDDEGLGDGFDDPLLDDPELDDDEAELEAPVRAER